MPIADLTHACSGSTITTPPSDLATQQDFAPAADLAEVIDEVDIDVIEDAEPAAASGVPVAALHLFPSAPVAAAEVTRGGDPFTTARPRPAGIFDGWSRTSEPTDDTPPPAPRWPWSR